MNVNVTVRHDSVTDDIRNYAVQKVTRLGRYLDRIHRADVVLDRQNERCVCEMIIAAVKGQVFTVTDTEEDWLKSIDLAADKMERQLGKFKEKLKSVNRRSGRLAAVAKPDESKPVEEDPSYGEIVDNYE